MQRDVLAERIPHRPILHFMLREQRLAWNSGHINYHVRLAQLVAVQAFRELAVERNAALAQHCLRGRVNESQRRNSGAFRQNNVRAVMARYRFGHLAAHAIPHADEKHFYRRLHQGDRISQIGEGLNREFGRIFWENFLAGMPRGGTAVSLRDA